MCVVVMKKSRCAKHFDRLLNRHHLGRVCFLYVCDAYFRLKINIYNFDIYSNIEYVNDLLWLDNGLRESDSKLYTV